jgi:hypothetical protein
LVKRALLAAGEVGALIFTKVDRASRCTEDYARLIRLSEEQDWQLRPKQNNEGVLSFEYSPEQAAG